MISFKLWLEATSKEDALKDAKSAYMYAQNVVRGRSPEGEAVIAKDPRWAYLYAKNIIKDRWPEGEAAIATDPRWSFEYAHDVIKGRWLEGETAIAEHPYYALAYTGIIGGRWPEGEAAIMSAPVRKKEYLDWVLGSVYRRIWNFSDFIEHPDVVGLAENWPLLKKVINGSPKALRTFYMDWAPEKIRDMMLRYEP